MSRVSNWRWRGEAGDSWGHTRIELMLLARHGDDGVSKSDAWLTAAIEEAVERGRGRAREGREVDAKEEEEKLVRQGAI